MNDTRDAASRLDILPFAIIAGATLWYADMLAIVRDPIYAGYSQEQWTAAWLGLPIYATAVALLAAIVFAPGIASMLAPLPRRVYRAAAVWLSALALCALVMRSAPEQRHELSALLPVVSVLVVLASAALLESRNIAPNVVAVVWGGALVSASLVLLAANSMLITYPQRIPNATRASFMWLAVVLIFGHGFALLTRRAKPPLIAYAVMTVIPLVLSLFIPSLRMQRIESTGDNAVLFTQSAPDKADSQTMIRLLHSPPPAPALDGEAGPAKPNETPLPPSLGAVFQARGHATIAVVSLSPDVADTLSLDDSFDHVVLLNPKAQQRKGAFAALPRCHAVLHSVLPDAAPRGDLNSSEAVTYYARAFINEYRSTSFLLWAHAVVPAGGNRNAGAIREIIQLLGLHDTTAVLSVDITNSGHVVAVGNAPGQDPIPNYRITQIDMVAPAITAASGGTPPPEWYGTAGLGGVI